MYFLIFQWQIYINKLKHARKNKKKFYSVKTLFINQLLYCITNNNYLL